MKKNTKNSILRSEGAVFQMLEYFSELKSVSRYLNIKARKLSHSDVSYRIINHWEKEGLISDNRIDGKGWRKYSIVDGVWIHIISRLRNFGVALEIIKEIKKNLEFNGPNGNSPEQSLTTLEYYTALALYQKTPTYLLAFANGESLLCRHDEYVNSIAFRFIKDDHVKISINRIIQQMFPHQDLRENYNPQVELSSDEMKILHIIRYDKYNSITVKKRNGKIQRIEAEEKIDVDKRIVDILQTADYQNIEINQQNGTIVNIKRTIKKKMD